MGSNTSNLATASRAREDNLPEPMAAFLVAAARNDIGEARRLMAQLGPPDELIRVKSVRCGWGIFRNDDFSPLMLAAHVGNTMACRLLVEHSADVDVQQGYLFTALTMAAAQGHTSVCRLLVEAGAQLEHVGHFKFTALSWAAEQGHADTCDYLLEAGAKVVTEAEPTGCTLHRAATSGSLATLETILRRSGVSEEVVDELLGSLHGSDSAPGRELEINGQPAIPPLVVMAATVDTKRVQRLLDNGADVNAKTCGGWTPIVSAAHRGRFETVEMLIARGAAINHTTPDGLTALMAATAAGHNDTTRALLDAGAQTEVALDRCVSSALCNAVRNGHRDTVRLLLERGAAVDSRDDRGWIPLRIAAENGDVDTLSALVEAGAMKEDSKYHGAIALLTAAQRGQADAIRFLLSHGAIVHHPAVAGEHPALHEVAGPGNTEAVKALLEGGAADVDRISPFDGTTALMHALFYRRQNTVRVLLDAGANVDMQTDDGRRTALIIGAEAGHADYVCMLIDAGANVDIPMCSGKTAMVRATEKGRTAVVQALLESSVGVAVECTAAL